MNIDSLREALAERYTIDREIGQGGMATVFLAVDRKHGRQVAIKILRPEYAAAIGSERFLAEIRTTARLQHPNILPLLDSGEARTEHDEGPRTALYYVTPYVDGESLRDRLRREQRLPIDVAVGFASEMASALDYAHRHSLIHRDIKPENILLHDGHALVADFGIALDAASHAGRLTETGVSIGTPGYMSPEQALGERALDARSDVYGLGAVLYEMLTGVPPFTGPNAQAIVARVLTTRPVAPSRMRRRVPPHLAAAAMRALARQPADRFDSAAAFQAAITVGANRGNRFGMGVRIGALVLIVAIAAVFVVTRLASRNTLPTIALLHATTAVSDSATDQYMSDGISDEVFASLTSLPGLVVRGNRRLAPQLYPARGYRAIADSLGATMLVVLRVGHLGGALRVTVELQDVRRGVVIWSQTFAEAMGTDLNAIEDSIARNIIAQLSLKLAPVQLAAIKSGRTANPAAHDLLVLAKGYIANRSSAPEELDTAVTLIQSAIGLDSNYAQAWATLASARGLQAVFGADPNPIADFDSAAVAVTRALALDSNSADAHTTLGYLKVFHQRDYPGAGREFAKAIALDSNRANAWLFQAWYDVAAGDTKSAVASVRHAQRLDPLDPVIASRLGTLLYFDHQNTASLAAFDQLLKRQPNLLEAAAERSLIAASGGQCADLATLHLPPDFATRRPLIGSYVAAIDGYCHRAGDARQILAAMEGGRFNDPFWTATSYAALGDVDGMRRSLERGVREQAWAMFMLRTHPAFDAYRSEPWFQQIMAEVRLVPGAEGKGGGGGGGR